MATKTEFLYFCSYVVFHHGQKLFSSGVYPFPIPLTNLPAIRAAERKIASTIAEIDGKEVRILSLERMGKVKKNRNQDTSTCAYFCSFAVQNNDKTDLKLNNTVLETEWNLESAADVSALEKVIQGDCPNTVKLISFSKLVG